MFDTRLMKLARCIGAALLVSAGSGQMLKAQSVNEINVTDHRPLAEALIATQAVLGVAINYEDVPYENHLDMEDVSTLQQRLAYPGYRLLVPRKGHVAATLRTGSGVQDSENLLNLSTLLTSYRINRLPGDFAVEQANGMLYVVPTKVLASSGSVRDVKSVMSATISLPYAERTIAETISALVRAIGATTGARIAVGRLPFSPRLVIGFGVERLSARDALASLLAKATPQVVSYQLLFDPVAAYMLNVSLVQNPASVTAVAAPPPAQSPSISPFFVKN